MERVTEDAISRVVEERREVVVKEIKLQEEEDTLVLETTRSQPVVERDDDWFELVDVVPEEPVYVPPGIIPIIPCSASPFTRTPVFCACAHCCQPIARI